MESSFAGLPYQVAICIDCSLLIYCTLYRMYGFFQTTFYFSYMALFSATLSILCGKYCNLVVSYLQTHVSLHTGTIGFIGTSIFVRKIYSDVKAE